MAYTRIRVLTATATTTTTKNVGEEKIFADKLSGFMAFLWRTQHTPALQTQRLTFSSIPHALVYLTAASRAIPFFFCRFFPFFIALPNERETKRGSIIHRNHAIIFCV